MQLQCWIRMHLFRLYGLPVALGSAGECEGQAGPSVRITHLGEQTTSTPDIKNMQALELVG